MYVNINLEVLKYTFLTRKDAMDENQLSITALQEFKKLKNALAYTEQFICIKDASLPIWFTPPKNLIFPENISIRHQAFLYISQLEYLDDQDPREILIGPGIMAASKETISALEQLNIAKNNFKQAMLNLKKAKISTKNNTLIEGFEKILDKRPDALAISLKRMGLARIHLKQCYRVIPLLYKRPNKISWTWANTRSIKRITIQEAELQLQKNSRNTNLEMQIQKLRSLPNYEKLAIVQNLAPHLRANIVMPEASSVTRFMVKGPVPFFYLDSSNQPLPDIVPPGEKRKRDKDRPIRQDVKIEKEPFLPEIRAHRYIKHY